MGLTHRPQSSSFLGLPYRILNMNPKKELLWGLWVVTRLMHREAIRIIALSTLKVLATLHTMPHVLPTNGLPWGL